MKDVENCSISAQTLVSHLILILQICICVQICFNKLGGDITFFRGYHFGLIDRFYIICSSTFNQIDFELTRFRFVTIRNEFRIWGLGCIKIMSMIDFLQLRYIHSPPLFFLKWKGLAIYLRTQSNSFICLVGKSLFYPWYYFRKYHLLIVLYHEPRKNNTQFVAVKCRELRPLKLFISNSWTFRGK